MKLPFILFRRSLRALGLGAAAVLLGACAFKPVASLTVIAGGDCLLDRYGGAFSYDRALDGRWDALVEAARGSSSFVFNLETSVGPGGAPKSKRFLFRASPAALETLSRFPSPVAAMANNHSMDWGPGGAVATLAALDAAGIAHAGAGRSLAEAWLPARARTPAGDLLVYSCGVDNDASSFEDGRGAALAPLDPGQLGKRIAQTRAGAAALVVMLHWGAEYETRYRAGEQELARSLVDAGADLVVGTGPHVLRGVEAYRGGLICYSLGNLVFDDLGGEETATTALVRLRLTRFADGRTAKAFDLAPMKTSVDIRGPQAPDLPEARRIVDRIALRSPRPEVLDAVPPLVQGSLLWFPVRP